MQPTRREPTRLRLIDVMALIAGMAIGLWLVLADVKSSDGPLMGRFADVGLLTVVFVLGGLSLVGPVLLLAERARRRPWGAGKILWFSTGMSAWLMWPPLVSSRLSDRKLGDTLTAPCFAYGTPLMALYVTLALLAGGWLSRSRRRRKRSAYEQIGLLLGMLWACTGLYVLYLLYANDLLGRK